MSRRIVQSVLTAMFVVGLAGPALGGFSGTDVYLPSVARIPGSAGSSWYSTVWVYNPNPTPAQVQIYFHERLNANPSPLVRTRTLAAGETQRYTNAVQTLFGVEKAGAMRFVSTSKIVVNGRIYTVPTGAFGSVGEDKDSTGQFFAGIPASFAIGSGQSTQLLGMYQTTPFDSSQFRYNFGLVETAGASCTVRVTVMTATDTVVTFKDYPIGAHGAAQYQAKSEFPGVSTENARLKVEVRSGSGKVIAFGSGLANRSNDPSTFEMAFRDELLGGGTGGLTEVSHDATLTGTGTSSSLLGIANNGVTAGKIASGQVVKSLNGLHDAVTLAAGSNVTITPSGSTLTIAASGGSGGGDITGVTAGTGLTGGGTSGDVTLAVQVPLVLAGSAATTDATIAGFSTAGRGVAGSTASTHGAVEGWNTGTGPGVWGGNASGTTGYLGGATVGVLGVSGSGADYGVKGVSSDHVGVHGEGADYGVEGQSPNNGVYGTGNRGVVGQTSSSVGIGVEGLATGGDGVKGTSTSGYGVVGESASQAGVRGHSTVGAGVMGTSTSGAGVYGTTSSLAGVHGEGDSGDGVSGYSSTGNGVKGSTPSGWAVYGVNTGSGNAGLLGTPGYGGDFSGDVRVQGTLSKSAGSFVIDHPLDPEHKYLAHSFVESPDMKNVYDGVVVLDGRGTAVVELPEWFEALNRDFRYQLTCIGGFAPVYVAAEIASNRFTIAGGRPGLKVSWQVTGVRRDAYAEAHRIVVEQEKPQDEQGTYLYPELFGQGAEKSVETVRHPALVRDLSSKSSAVADHVPIQP
ncbi:MAG TPA: hypothetical protein PKL08_06430 [Thermoanaerobaculaceae bacterium]|nr:hypothetical protein [Thermoanaerobaculaceae bacterium]